MKILVTGFLGFIGSDFVRYISKEHPDWELWGMDKQTYASDPDRVKGTQLDVFDLPGQRYRLGEGGDISNRVWVMDAISASKPDVIVNYAAETHVDNSIADSSAFIQSNIVGVHNILDAIRLTSPKTRLIHISTDEVFGPRKVKFANLAGEDCMVFNPQNPYAASKLAAEALIRSYVGTYGIIANIVRSGNIYGLYQHPEKMIPKTIQRLMEQESVIVYGDGGHERLWTHISRHTGVVTSLVRGGGGANIHRHVRWEFCCSNLALVRRMATVLDLKEFMVKFVEDRPNHDRNYGIGPAGSEISVMVDGEPRFMFNQTVREIADEYRKSRQNSR